jgi:hypothetical protein
MWAAEDSLCERSDSIHNLADSLRGKAEEEIGK